jgi:hypothetical protein
MSCVVLLLDRLYRLGWRILAMMAVFMAVSLLHAHLREMQFPFHRQVTAEGEGSKTATGDTA